VSAEPLDDAHPYIGAVTLNGKPFSRVYLHHAEILAGGELHFTMQAKPNTQWGTQPAERPSATSHYGT
jgi:putative alpha-1,2-mannosidase